MRVRTSSGIRPIDFLGNFYMTNATEMIFGTIDADKTVSVELKHDDKLPVESSTYIQVCHSFMKHHFDKQLFIYIGCFTLYKYFWSTSFKNIVISINSNIIIYISLSCV
jgi:hypothetical protein